MMAKLSVIYFSKTGNTKAMAEAAVEGMKRVAGVEAKAYPIDAVDADFVRESIGVVFGTPVYGGGPAAEFYTYLEKGLKGLDLAGKLGGAFATEQYIHGGATNTIIDILRRLLVEGMMIYSSGHACGKPFIHYGPVEVSPDTDRFAELFRTYGERFAKQAVSTD